MKLLFSVFFCLAAVIRPAMAERTIPWFVSTEWLSTHMNDNNLVILQVGFGRGEFKLGHIPGARFLWFNSLAPSNPDLSTEMPDLKEGTNVLQELGITKTSTIVLVFNGSNVTITTRMFLALAYFGFGEQTSVLDGGFEMWKKEGRPVEKGLSPVKKTKLKLTTNTSVITDADWVKRNLDNPAVAIVDARTRNFYDGNGGGIFRQGHIKGAKHLVFNSVLDSTNRLKPAAELQRLFDSAGVKKGNTVVSYCHVGQQATLVYVVARSLGYDAKVYDGCFEDWNIRDDSYPVEKKKEEPPPPPADTTTIGMSYFACPPCGCAGDNKKHPKAGNCPDCGMAMIEKKMQP